MTDVSDWIWFVVQDRDLLNLTTRHVTVVVMENYVRLRTVSNQIRECNESAFSRKHERYISQHFCYFSVNPRIRSLDQIGSSCRRDFDRFGNDDRLKIISRIFLIFDSCDLTVSRDLTEMFLKIIFSIISRKMTIKWYANISWSSNVVN